MKDIKLFSKLLYIKTKESRDETNDYAKISYIINVQI